MKSLSAAIIVLTGPLWFYLGSRSTYPDNVSIPIAIVLTVVGLVGWLFTLRPDRSPSPIVRPASVPRRELHPIEN
jgi:hypothetical protein